MIKPVLVACEYSGVVRDALSRAGVDAYSCDLLPTESELTIYEGRHLQGDVKDILKDYDWPWVFAHPPCTRLCNSGVRWLHERNLWQEMEEACEFFNLFSKYPGYTENPIPHKYARGKIGDYSQIIHPWQFGHGEQKATCLWLRGLTELKPTKIVSGREQKVWKMSPGKDRWKNRSTTYPGIAEAMAKQWGNKLHRICTNGSNYISCMKTDTQ